MKIITISIDPADNTELKADHARIKPWAASNGWKYLSFSGVEGMSYDIRDQVQANNSPIETLEIVAVGSVSCLADMTALNAEQVGKELTTGLGFAPHAEIFLSGCNTGLGGPAGFPSAFARGTGCNVWGTCGYLTGTKADGSAKITKTPSGSVGLPMNEAWKEFLTAGDGLMDGVPRGLRITLTTPRFTAHLEDVQARHFSRLLERTRTEKDPIRGKHPNAAPDAIITWSAPDGDRVYHVLGRGAYLRDERSGKVWRFHHKDAFERAVRRHIRLNF